ncbi:CrcB family protein [Roseomonas xinghualingensis]|uniref:CrcB family protein n=1 Tax=Roseomonas xinghualingensis TaxID=2986475 RepID=UPI0021F18D2B|nr:CrcB family protein [Roseomonas sp. SXEYE001]MCV4208185.1 CrcB family protein [Roseomonas sp. SXEYE001]
MLNIIILVFAGGALGAILRELLMLGVPHLSDGFPLDILVANVGAAFLLGLASGLHQRRLLSDNLNVMIGTGIMGGLSTFSSFVYGAYVLMTASATGMVVAVIYLLVSLALGYGAVVLGLRIGTQRQKAP